MAKEYKVLVKGGLGLIGFVAQEGEVVWDSTIGDPDTVQRFLEARAIEETDLKAIETQVARPAIAASAVEIPVEDHEADVHEDKPE